MGKKYRTWIHLNLLEHHGHLDPSTLIDFTKNLLNPIYLAWKVSKMYKQDDKEITIKNFTTIFLDRSLSRAPDGG